MLMPSIFGENLFDDFFGDFPFYYDDRAVYLEKTYLMTGWMILDSEIISLAERTLFMANMQKIS